jgi:hypothetical protein
MSKDGLTQVEYALMLGRLGYEVIPFYWKVRQCVLSNTMELDEGD